ncbi:hypothetical protein MASR1M45_02010 [Candidatus Kapaibacterium sp.]
MDKRYVFYLIDEDEQNLEILQKLILKIFPSMYVKKFHDSIGAVKSIEKEKMDIVVICEYDMQNYNGLQVLRKIRSDEERKDTYFLMMSSNPDREVMIKSMQMGVDDYITKPFGMDQIFLRLKIISKILTLNSKIEKSKIDLDQIKSEFVPLLEKTRNLFVNIQNIRFPEKMEEIERIVSAANYIAKQLTTEIDELNEIDNAAKICYLPKIFFKDRLAELPIMVNGIVHNPSMTSYNEFIKVLFGEFNGFHGTMEILNSIYENFDGSGIPNKLKSWAIPLGSRILRTAIDFEYHFSRNPKKIDNIIPIMWTEINKVYDFRILTFYDQYLAYLNSGSSPNHKTTEVQINPFNLTKNMVLSRNIITVSGLKLLNVGTKLDDNSIAKIQEAKLAKAIIGHVYVKIETIPVSVA